MTTSERVQFQIVPADAGYAPEPPARALRWTKPGLWLQSVLATRFDPLPGTPRRGRMSPIRQQSGIVRALCL